MICYVRRRKGLRGSVQPEEAIKSGNEGQGPVHQVADLPGEDSMTKSALQTARTIILALRAPYQVSSVPQPKRSEGRVNPTKASNSAPEQSRRSRQRENCKSVASDSDAERTPANVSFTRRQARENRKRVAADSDAVRTPANVSLTHGQARENRKRVAADSDAERTPTNVSLTRRQARRRVRNGRHEGKLDDKVLNEYLGGFWQKIPSEKKDSHAYMDCLWFEMYNEGDRERVLQWIRRDKIFSKKYVFLPICQYNHWSLLIFCHVGKDLLSNATTPCLLLLDSLCKANPKQDLEKVLRKLLLDIYEGEGITASKRQIDKIPLLVPKVPQQTGDKECGYYVLYYITQFLMRSPETFSVSESDGYPYFMSQGWFTAADVRLFRKDLPPPDQEADSRNDSSDDASDDLMLIE